MPISIASSPHSARRSLKCRPPISCPSAPRRRARVAMHRDAKPGSCPIRTVPANTCRWRRRRMSDSERQPPALRPVDFDPFAITDQPFELTEPQREMIAATMMGDEANASYNQCFALTLTGPLSHDSLRRALGVVVARHDALRIRIDVLAERQQILPSVDVALPEVDLSTLDDAERAVAIGRLLDEETRKPFDLDVAPLWRAQLVREAPDRHVFVFTAHHLVADGWSSAVIFSDLAKCYVEDRFGLAAALPQ